MRSKWDAWSFGVYTALASSSRVFKLTLARGNKLIGASMENGEHAQRLNDVRNESHDFANHNNRVKNTSSLRGSWHNAEGVRVWVGECGE